MRKIIFVGTVLMMFLSVSNIVYGETLPESIKEMVLKDLGFYNPVEKSFTSQLFISSTNENVYFASFQEMDASMTGGVGAKTYLWRDNFFIPYGYLIKFRKTETERGQFNWGEYNEMWMGGVKDLAPAQKLQPYLRMRKDEIIVVTIAKRVLKSIDYVNKWKISSENLDAWSFTFSYFLEPALPELPKLGPYTNGKGTAILNPATGQWETRFGPNYGSSLVDGGDFEYTAWLERQTVPSTLPTKPSQPLGQIPSLETAPEKITIDWLTKNIADTDYFVAQSKIFDVPFDIVWAAVNKYFANAIATSDPNKGILVTKQITNYTGDLKYQNFILIEKASETSTKITVKSFYYKYVEYRPPHQYLNGWQKLDPDVGSGSTLRSIEKEIKNQEKQSLSTAIIFAQKDNKKEALFWLERALKSNIVNLKMIKDLESKSFSKYKKDLDYILLIQKYLGYSVTVDGKQYRVGGDIFTGGKERVFVFVNEKGAVVRDLALVKKIAQVAWVYENVVKAPGLLSSKRVSAILETHKRLRQYELTQGILARASVQILAATISGGATLTYTVPASLTWRVVHEQFLNLKGLLSLTGRQGLEEALSKYQQIESSIANLKPNSIDEVTAVEIRRLYEPAHGLELSCGALLTSLMPKRGRQLLEKALKDVGDELVRTLPLSDEVLITRDVLDLQGKMDDALKTDPAFKEYYEKLDLAKRLKEANEQVITAWAEQAVGYKE